MIQYLTPQDIFRRVAQADYVLLDPSNYLLLIEANNAEPIKIATTCHPLPESVPVPFKASDLASMAAVPGAPEALVPMFVTASAAVAVADNLTDMLYAYALNGWRLIKCRDPKLEIEFNQRTRKPKIAEIAIPYGNVTTRLCWVGTYVDDNATCRAVVFNAYPHLSAQYRPASNYQNVAGIFALSQFNAWFRQNLVATDTYIREVQPYNLAACWTDDGKGKLKAVYFDTITG